MAIAERLKLLHQIMTRAPASWAMLLLACLGIYHAGMGPYLLFDDFNTLSPLLQGQSAAESPGILLSYTGSLGRPVSMLSFAVNIGLAGPDIESIKLVNIFIHLVTGLLLYFLTRRLLETSGIVARGEASWLPTVIAGLWLLHPLHVSTVLYAVQRMTLLSSLFMAAGLLSYVCGRQRLRDGQRHGLSLIALTYLFFFPLAILSKENGFILPAYLFLIEIALFPAVDRQQHALQERLLRWGPLVVPLLAGMAWLLATEARLLTDGYATREFTLTERLLTESRAVVDYLTMTFVPDLTQMRFLYDNLPISTGLLSPVSTLYSLLTLGLLLVLAVICLGKAPLIGYAILFFFASHLIESTVVPLDLMYEHRNYLASYGLLLAGTLTLHRHLRSEWLRAVLGILALSVLGTLLMLRTGMWSDEQRLYHTLHRLNPGSDQIASQLAEIYMNGSRPDLALSILGSGNSAGRQAQRLYIKCRATGALAPGDITSLQSSLDKTLPNYLLTGLIQLANLGLDRQCRYDQGEYIALLTSTLERPLHNTDRYRLLLYRAQLQQATRHLDEAIASLDAAHKAWPVRPEPLLLAAEWMAQAGKATRAMTYYNDARKIARDQGIDARAAEEQVQHLIDKASRGAGTKPPR